MLKARSFLNLLLIVVMGLSLILSGAEAANANNLALAEDSYKPQLLFTGSDNNLYTSDADGNNRKQLTKDGKADSFNSQWSPDGRMVAYSQSTGQNSAKLFVTNSDGSDNHVVVNSMGSSFKWSPDSTKLAYRTGSGVYIVNADGKNTKTAIHDQKVGYFTYSNGLDWSPDGKQIIFDITPNFNFEQDKKTLFSAGVDGSNLQSRFDFTGILIGYWPDGQRVAYQGDVSYGMTSPGTLTIQKLDGTDKQAIIKNDNTPDLSPNAGKDRVLVSGFSLTNGVLNLSNPAKSFKALPVSNAGHIEDSVWSNEPNKVIALIGSNSGYNLEEFDLTNSTSRLITKLPKLDVSFSEGPILTGLSVESSGLTVLSCAWCKNGSFVVDIKTGKLTNLKDIKYAKWKPAKPFSAVSLPVTTAPAVAVTTAPAVAVTTAPAVAVTTAPAVSTTVPVVAITTAPAVVATTITPLYTEKEICLRFKRCVMLKPGTSGNPWEPKLVGEWNQEEKEAAYDVLLNKFPDKLVSLSQIQDIYYYHSWYNNADNSNSKDTIYNQDAPFGIFLKNGENKNGENWKPELLKSIAIFDLSNAKRKNEWPANTLDNKNDLQLIQLNKYSELKERYGTDEITAFKANLIHELTHSAQYKEDGSDNELMKKFIDKFPLKKSPKEKVETKLVPIPIPTPIPFAPIILVPVPVPAKLCGMELTMLHAKNSKLPLIYKSNLPVWGWYTNGWDVSGNPLLLPKYLVTSSNWNEEFECPGVERPATPRGFDGQEEDMAESVALYVYNPKELQKISPERYKWVKEQLFNNAEFK